MNRTLISCIIRISTGIVVCAAAVVSARATASETTPDTISLEQVLRIAHANATEIKIITTEEKAGQAEVDIYRSEALPHLSFGSGATYTSGSQATQKMQQAMMLAMFGGASPSAGTDNEFMYPDRINGYAFNWSLNLQQPLITFGKVSSALKLARMQKCTIKDMKQMRTDLFYLRVMQEFSSAFLAQKDVAIHTASTHRAQQLLIRTKSEFEAGRAIKRDLHRVEALVQREHAEFIAAEGLQKTATQRLLTTICFKDSTNFVALEINRSGTMSNPPASSGPGSIQLALKKNEAAMYKAQYRYIRSAYFPTVNLVGSITNQFMTIDTNGLLEELLPEETPYDQIQVLGETFDAYNPKPDKYFDPDFFNYSIGLQLNWTLFDGNRTRAQCRQIKNKLDKALLELDKMENENRIALEEAENQITTIDSMSSAVLLQIDAAREAFKQTEQDYKDGFTDFTTLLDTDKEYRDAVRLLNGLKIQRIIASAQLRITMGLPVFGETE